MSLVITAKTFGGEKAYKTGKLKIGIDFQFS